MPPLHRPGKSSPGHPTSLGDGEQSDLLRVPQQTSGSARVGIQSYS